jgi:galactose mutarotase-like enzyme
MDKGEPRGVSDRVELACGPARATISRRGGELEAWSVGGHDLLWRSDPAVWPRTSPILFPIVGWARDGQIRIDGEPRSMGVHGFAADRFFELVDRGETSALFALQDDAETRTQYPFAFRLEVHYRLGPQNLAVELRLINRGERDLPYAIGFHPGFAWPLSGTVRPGHAIEFAEAEDRHVPIITASGMFTSATRTIPLDGKRLMLSDELLQNEAVCFLRARSRSLRYIAPDGASLAVTFENFPHIAFWSLPPARFICVEAWTGHGDPDGFAGDIWEKPSMLTLAPESASSHALTFTFSPAVS